MKTEPAQRAVQLPHLMTRDIGVKYPITVLPSARLY
jgi:hypothetical protein